MVTNRIKETNKWLHFLIFSGIWCLVIVLMRITIFYIEPETTPIIIISLILVLSSFPILFLFMIRTFKAYILLSIKTKILFLTGLLVVNLLFVPSMNLIKLSMTLTSEEFKNGVLGTLKYSICMGIVCVPIIIFVKSKLLNDETYNVK
ncbi:MAG: hypothetical protein FWC39_08495 [Bacteroidetes bacterium]|nr:hypothetical protein [Bacteroidota bacterium]